MLRGLYTTTAAPSTCVFEAGGDGGAGAGQHARELVHGDHIIVPGVLVRLGCGGAGHDVVELSAQHQRPRVVQTLQRIGRAAQPCGGHRGALGGVSQQLILAIPTLVLRFGSQRAGRVIGELKVALVMQQVAGLAGPEDVEKHLVGFGGDHAHGAVAHLNRSALGLRGLLFVQIRPVERGRQNRAALGYDGFQQFHRGLRGSAADVAGAVIVIIDGEGRWPCRPIASRLGQST